MEKPITLYLIGFAGSGKYTIAKEMANHGYKVVDNHLINNPIFSLMNLDDKAPLPEIASIYTGRIRQVVLDYVSQDKEANYIFTNELLETEADWTIYKLIEEAAESRGSLFVPLKLTLSVDEHLRRITTPERAEMYKTTNPEYVHWKKEMISVDHPHLFEMDVTDLSPSQVADKIMYFIEELRRGFKK